MVSAFVPFTNPMTNNEMVHSASPTSVLSYESHDYFYIVNDTDLVATAAAESWEGNGSPETPFLIQGYEINPMIEDIHIENTRLHFKILDCNISGALGGIALENVTNGVIQNCLFSDNEYGIYLRNDTGIDILGCSFTVPDSFGESGIYMSDAIDISIESCILEGISGSDAGIYGEYCDDITIYNTTIFEFDNHGIFFGGSDDIDILENTIYWNEGEGIGPVCGIYLVEGEFANIEGNNITQNSDNGISLSGFDNVTIINNDISENWIHGIYVELSDFCVIEDNYIGYNGEGAISSGPMCGISTYFADYIEIIGNEFWWNAENTITLGYSNDAYIFNNYINHSYNHGMWIYASHNATIEENEIYNSDGLGGGSVCGIMVEWSNDTSLVNNILGENTEHGVTIRNSHNGLVSGNIIFDSYYVGLYLVIASGWEITHNVIFDNGAPGIYLEAGTQDNIFYYNDIGWSGEFLVGDDGDNQWNYTGIGNWYSDYNGTGTYDIFGSGGAIDFYPSMSLYLGTTIPYEYEAGTTGNTMTWAASALNPGTYELLIDGVSQGQVAWDGGPIAADVDGLAVGEYNVTLIVYHISGHWLANQSVLTVVDTEGPTWTITPQDQVLEYNEALSYQLEASDPSGIASWAVNDTSNFHIGATGLLTNATILEPGVYFVEITVTDIYSHSVSVIIMITVNKPAPPPNQTMLFLAIGGAGAAVAIILLVIFLKKKSS